MITTDLTAAIEARLTADEAEYGPGMADQTIRDRRALLWLVREQAGRLEAIDALTVEAEDAANQYGRNLGCVGVGKLRAAITATEGA